MSIKAVHVISLSKKNPAICDVNLFMLVINAADFNCDLQCCRDQEIYTFKILFLLHEKPVEYSEKTGDSSAWHTTALCE